MFLGGRIHAKTQSDLVIQIQYLLVEKINRCLFSRFPHRAVNSLPQYAEAPCPSIPAGPAGVEGDKGEARYSCWRHQPGVLCYIAGRWAWEDKQLGWGRALSLVPSFPSHVTFPALGSHLPSGPASRGPLTLAAPSALTLSSLLVAEAQVLLAWYSTRPLSRGLPPCSVHLSQSEVTEQ